ncbi:MAG TPA: acetyl-CoA hydrolase/transferase C-terminal domain-containing protein [Spirochaetota bacterium]|nr:4-hydroxybutyrate CoA-transferase [Spirochaetota bacterium]HOD13910.1 acetyl-CoA hydrolase/transferase C-terminal domain-containing protein [Spirochaetota bacterium]HPG49706.1 acetyl-CoA hydrolase/transferase C-terminal domain-containing protein [Spirochaetota bacterium]HPN12410.1 acetyl-CoA hydrolase/transferase C-terminal domain-containing protein [Spirochaetota bacterium]HQL80706.1 acetyl-CoA hydrolase/transferase C-terminal domain-containing protein [Spirochaetota bacterium]
MSWEEIYRKKLVSIKDAVKVVRSGDFVCTPGGPSAAYDLITELAGRYEELENVTMSSALMMRPLPHFEAKYKGHIGHLALFMGPLERIFWPQGNIKVNSCSFSNFDDLITQELRPDVLFVECAEPDEWGYMSFGPGGASVNHSILKTAREVVVQVNKKVPYVFGTHAHMHVSQATCICEQDHDIPILPNIPITDVEKKIASHIVERIQDGSTVQLGFGAIANAVGFFLDGKKDLGVHTEMITDSMMDLAKKGVVNGSKKAFYPGKMTFGFGVGSKELYEFMHRNPMIESMPIHMVNDISNIAMNDNFISINNALTVDLTGQVCSESIGFNMFSSTGGQLDFVRGARRSKGGMSFIALNSMSMSKQGPINRIVATLPPGTVVTTPRSDVQYVVTEYGIADLWLKSIEDRVRAMISIAHPDFREELEKSAFEAGLLGK